MHKMNWDDLRYVLAVADAGSVSKAGKALNVNHATVLRRVSLFEERFGVGLFDRTPQGYRLPREHDALIDAVREVEHAVHAVERLIEGGKAPLSGKVRVTSTDTLCLSILPAVLGELQGEADGLMLELISTNAHLDMSRLDADITVRPAPELPEHLVGEQAGALVFGVYHRKGQAPRGDAQWLGLTGPVRRTLAARWMDDNVSENQIAGAADSFLTLREMAASGAGLAFLPRMLAMSDPRLQECTGLAPEFSVPVWVASHADMQRVPRITQVSRVLVRKLRERSALLAGRTTAP